MKVFTSNQTLQFLVAFNSVKSQYEIKMYYARYLKKKDNNNKKKNTPPSTPQALCYTEEK